MKDNKKSNAQILMGMIILLIGSLGVGLWSLGYILNNTNSVWLGRIILSILTLVVLIAERFLK